MKSPLKLKHEYFYDKPVCAYYTIIRLYLSMTVQCTVIQYIYIGISIVVTDITWFHSHH